MFLRRQDVILTLLLVFFVIACSGERSPNRIRIVKLTPDEGTILSKGSEVNLVVEVDYQLESASGTIGLVVQDQDNNPITQTLVVVQKGARRIILKKTFTIPDKVESLFVFTPLYVRGKESSVASDSIGFSLK